MAKISINLLPPEIITTQLKQANFYKIQLIGIVVILIMVFLSSLTVTLRILQSQKIAQLQTKITQDEQKISVLKDTQAALFLLKDRLLVIDKYWGISSNQYLMYELVDKLIPADFTINSITIGKGGEVSLLALLSDTASLDDLMKQLTTKESNEEKVKQVGVESLNRGRDGIYRVTLTIKPK